MLAALNLIFLDLTVLETREILIYLKVLSCNIVNVCTKSGLTTIFEVNIYETVGSQRMELTQAKYNRRVLHWF